MAIWVILVISFSMAMSVTDDAAGDVGIAPVCVGDVKSMEVMFC